MGSRNDSTRPVRRDQQRALYAYRVVQAVKQEQWEDYKIAVNDVGASILRSGLCAAIANLQRLGKRGELVIEHLAGSAIPGLETANHQDFARQIRELDADSYMFVTRELLQVATWLKRAVQASPREADHA